MTPDRKPLRRPFSVAAVVTAIALSSVLIGTSTSYAFWSATANTSVVTTSGAVNVVVGDFTTTALANHRLATTFPVTVQNATVRNNVATPTDIALKLDASPTGFAANANVVVWNQAISACTAPSPTPLATGTWSTLNVPASSYAQNETKTFCVRTSLTRAVDASDASGTRSFGARITATAAVGNFTATSTKSFAQSTEFIYPLGSTVAATSLRVHVGSVATDLCLDVSGNGGTGTIAIPWGCHNDSNQQWQFTAVDASYFRITPQHNTALRLTASSTANGAQVQVVSNNAANQLQEWQLQISGTGQYQLVNRASGYCLTSSSTSGATNTAMTMAPCDGSLAQRFLPRLRTFTCAVNSTLDWWHGYRTLQLSWASTTGTRALLVDGVQVAPTTNTNTGITYEIDQNGYSANSTHSFTVIQSGTVLASGIFKMNGSGWLSDCTAS